MTEKQKMTYSNDHSEPFENSADAIGKNTKLSILMVIPDFEWLFKWMEDYLSLMACSAAARLLELAALILLVHSEKDIYRYAWISVSVPFVTCLLQMAVCEKKWQLRFLPVLSGYHSFPSVFYSYQEAYAPFAS